MFFKKKKELPKEKKESYIKNRDIDEIVEKKVKNEKKLDKVSEEVIAKAIKDLLSK